jgi:uncharacterized protein
MNIACRIVARGSVLACIAFFSGVLPVGAAQRVALVIGNAHYAAAPVLRNPVSDAHDLAASLRGLGFDVIALEDATRTGMADAIRNFSGKLAGADTALFFYAGHGLQLNGENYLVPVDAHVQGVADVRFGTINLNDIMGELDGKDRANIIILDSCRDNPFADVLSKGGRSIGPHGLGRVDTSGVGTLVVYSTQPNNVALDGEGRNSPFTSALLKHLGTPGLEVRQMISRVRSDVLDATNRVQIPWDNSSLVGEVYLSPAHEPAAAPAAATASGLPSSDTAELLFWQSVARADSKEMYDGYLSRYGDKGQFAFLARQRLAELSRIAALPPPAAPAAPVSRTAPAQAPADIAANPAATPVTDCDRAAAPAVSVTRLPDVPGRASSAIDPAVALPACQAAVTQYPDEPRFKYQLGRVQVAAKNFIEANQLFEAAIKGGSVDAIYELGASYFLGRGIPQNYQRAFELFSKAADLNDPNSMVGLGAMYADGRFVQKDPVKSQALYSRAIQLGDYAALRNLGILYLNGAGLPRNYAMARDYFEQAAGHGDTQAMKLLSDIYKNGWGVAKDMRQSREWEQKAAAVQR